MTAPGWQRVAGALWSIERRTPEGWSLRSVAVGLGDGGVLVAGPLRNLPEAAHAELAGIGRPTLLLAPNHFHHLGLPEHVARYPDAVAVASAAARPRLRRQTGRALASLDVARARLPPGVELLEPPGLANGEVWLRVATSEGVVLCVTDAFFHVPEQPRGLVGALLRLTGTTPGLRLGATFRALAVADCRAYLEWLRVELGARRPTVLVPAHGAVLRDPNLGPRLAAIAAFALA